jgi:hypothetical protein
VGKSPINILGAKSEQKKLRVPKIKKELLLSKIEIKLICSISLPKWQENKLQKLSAEKLKEKGLAWVPKASIQAQKDVQASGATKAKERRRFKKQLPKLQVCTKSSIFFSYAYMEFIPRMHGYL